MTCGICSNGPQPVDRDGFYPAAFGGSCKNCFHCNSSKEWERLQPIYDAAALAHLDTIDNLEKALRNLLKIARKQREANIEPSFFKAIYEADKVLRELKYG